MAFIMALLKMCNNSFKQPLEGFLIHSTWPILGNCPVNYLFDVSTLYSEGLPAAHVVSSSQVNLSVTVSNTLCRETFYLLLTESHSTDPLQCHKNTACFCTMSLSLHPICPFKWLTGLPVLLMTG